MKKIAVITGASSGMGKRFAETIDQFGTFDEVWVIARQWDKLEALRDTVPFPIRVLAMDLTDRASFNIYKAALAEEPVQVGLLMNCSGYGKFSAVLDTPLEVNLNMTDLNCQAVVAMCQLTAPYMPRGSQIINIASVAARNGGGLMSTSLYAASKGGVISLTKGIARELAPYHIRVNAIAPGSIDTPMTTAGRDPAEYEETIRKMPLHRRGRPEELVGPAVLLLSDAGAFMVGTTLDVNGGSYLY